MLVCKLQVRIVLAIVVGVDIVLSAVRVALLNRDDVQTYIGHVLEPCAFACVQADSVSLYSLCSASASALRYHQWSFVCCCCWCVAFGQSGV